MKVITAAACLAIAFAAGIGTALVIDAPNRARPDREQMRRYRLTLIGDNELLEMHAQAERDYASARMAAQEAKTEFWRRREAAMNACESNPAQKLRRPDISCFIPLPVGIEDLGNPLATVEDLFAHRVLGVCSYTETVREARTRGCLPQN